MVAAVLKLRLRPRGVGLLALAIRDEVRLWPESLEEGCNAVSLDGTADLAVLIATLAKCQPWFTRKDLHM